MVKIFENKCAVKEEVKSIIWREKSVHEAPPKRWERCVKGFQLRRGDGYDWCCPLPP